jgi:ketosteroid isomerase-like protein
MSQENVELVRRGFELWNVAAGDPDERTWRVAMAEMLAGYHPEAELDFSRTLPDFPTTGDVSEAMTAWVEGARGSFTEVRIEATDLIDAGDAVVAGMRISGEGAISGVKIESEFFYTFRFREGQIVAATTYVTRREALKAVGLEEAGS